MRCCRDREGGHHGGCRSYRSKACGELIQAKVGGLVCPAYTWEDLAFEEVAVRGSGVREQYGTRRLLRAHLVCDNWGCVVDFDLEKLGGGLRADGGRQQRGAGAVAEAPRTFRRPWARTTEARAHLCRC